MSFPKARVRVLYRFSNKLGARLAAGEWLGRRRGDMLEFPGVLQRPVPAGVKVRTTLAWGKLRISYENASGPA